MVLLNDHPIPNLVHPSDSTHNTYSINNTSTPLKHRNGSWYSKRAAPSSELDDSYNHSILQSNEDENEEEEDTTANRTPSPRKIINSDGIESRLSSSGSNSNIFASTPLHPNSTVSFMSPMRRLNDLHIESSPLVEIDPLGDDINDEEEDDDDEDDEFSYGNKTITNDTDSDVDDKDEIMSSNINSRKRMHVESPSMMILTPSYPNNEPQNSNESTGNSKNMSSFNIHNITTSSLDYSTPCPNEPRRKKLKLKQETTPKKVLLDLAHSIKTSIDKLPKTSSHVCYEDNEEEPIREQEDFEQMPISSSTPSTSRASTPPLTTPEEEKENKQHQEEPEAKYSSAYEEYGQTINGYKFVQRKLPQFKYETPVNNNRYSKLREAYNANDYTPMLQPQGKYQIMGEFPMSSAGIMEEDDENVHVGDKRISDPYLECDNTADSIRENRIREEYFSKEGQPKLPILPPHFYETRIPQDTLISLINKDNLMQFYEMVKSPQQQLSDLLKQERVKWHPDKWIGKLQNQEHGFNLEVVSHLCQCINGLLESITT